MCVTVVIRVCTCVEGGELYPYIIMVMPMYIDPKQ